MTKKYIVTFSPKNAPKARFVHRQFDKKSDAERRVKMIKKVPMGKRKMLNPRVSKNPFHKKKSTKKLINLRAGDKLTKKEKREFSIQLAQLQY